MRSILRYLSVSFLTQRHGHHGTERHFVKLKLFWFANSHFEKVDFKMNFNGILSSVDVLIIATKRRKRDKSGTLLQMSSIKLEQGASQLKF